MTSEGFIEGIVMDVTTNVDAGGAKEKGLPEPLFELRCSASRTNLRLRV